MDAGETEFLRPSRFFASIPGFDFLMVKNENVFR